MTLNTFGVCLILEVLRCIWIQQYYRGSEPGLRSVRWRQHNEEPPSALRIQSPP